jgi:B-box zinc finger
VQEESIPQSVQLVENTSDPLLEIFGSCKMTAAKIAAQAQRELCSKHQLRKTLLCQPCKTFMCDRCLIEGNHTSHKTQNLSKIANDIVNIFQTSLANLTENLDSIEQTKP